MQRSTCWYKATAVSLLLHCLLLFGVGWKATNNPVTPKEEHYTELEFAPDTAEMNVVTPVGDSIPTKTEAIVADSVSEKEKITAPEMETQEPRQQTEENSRSHVPAAKIRPSTTVVADKDVPAKMLFHYSQNQLDLALAQYNQALKLDSKFAFAYSNRGQVYYDKGEIDKAFADFNQALVINPQLASAHIGRGFIYIKKDQWDSAREDFNQALISGSHDALAYYGRALCFAKIGDRQKAISDFRSFIQYATPEYNLLIQAARQLLAEMEG